MTAPVETDIAHWETLTSESVRQYRNGRYLQATKVAEAALAIAEQLFGPQHPSTGTSLNNLAELHRAMGAYNKALPLYLRALEIFERAEGPQHPSTGTSLNNLAELHRAMGAYNKALPLSLRALEISEQTEGLQHPSTSIRLNNLAGLYESMGAYDKALPLYLRALDISEQTNGPQHPSTAGGLNNLAGLYRAMGAYDIALPMYLRALEILEQAGGPKHPSTGIGLNNLAELYRAMGAYDKALPMYLRALEISEQANGLFHPQTGTRLNNLAGLYRAKGAYDKALPMYLRALDIFERTNGSQHPSTGTSLNDLAGLYESMGAYDKALPMYLRALEISEQTEGLQHPNTGTSLNNLAGLYRAMGAYDKALPLYLRALEIALSRFQNGHDPELMLRVAGNLCQHLARGDTTKAEAVFYCKLAVNAQQRRRSGAQGLDSGMRSTLASSEEGVYQLLARLLSEQGRLREAEQVLDQLKEAEYREWVRGEATETGAAVGFTPQEQPLYDAITAVGGQLAPVYAALDAHQRHVQTLDGPALELLRERRNQLQQQLQEVLAQVAARLQPSTEMAPKTLDPSDTQNSRLTAELAKVGESSVVVSYVMGKDHTVVLVATPAGTTATTLPAGRMVLNPLIDALRLAIRNKHDYRQPARALHAHLVAPVEALLQAQNQQPTTWMLFLVDRLRYLPFAALVDANGKHLVESKRLAVFTGTARDLVTRPASAPWSVAAFGSTAGLPSEQLLPLPAVREEIDAIVRSPHSPQATLPGQAWMDADFSRAAWQKLLDDDSGHRHSVLHLATHFQARPGNWLNAFLLLGSGEQYRISELNGALNVNLSDLELVTLSACATELTDQADGREVDGLGTLFQKKGARAVIGTLWPVQDEGSAALVQGFYAARGEQRQMSKAAALQSAQLQLLRGQKKSRNPAVDLSHPYYWAPFILMGNWL